MNETMRNKNNDTLAAFAGLIILFAVLAVIFGLTAPVGHPSTANQPRTQPSSEPHNIVQEQSAEATELLVELSVETPEIATEEAILEPTEIVLIVEVTPEATPETSAVIASSYSPELIAQGETLFVTCSACHGADARGIPGLGKDLVAGEFALTTSDADLVSMIMTGRPIWDAANTTGVDMPARGGNPALTEADVTAIVAYLRSLQSGSPDTGSAAEDTTISTSSYSPEMIAQGEALYVTCSACHGADARGIPGLGKDLVAGEYVLSATDEELFSFIITGRPIWDAANTTGIDMPARGGNPALSDDDVMAIVAYLRSLQNP